MFARLASAAVFVFAAFSSACGARTDLTYERFDAGGPMPECSFDADCDDDVECTVDRCEAGRCTNPPSEALCDDDQFCNGLERCDASRGCVSAPAPCMHPVMCVEWLCDERIDACGELVLHADRCPLSHRCDEALGCVARALVHDTRALYEIDLPSGVSNRIGPVDLSLTDIALHPDGTTYGITRSSLFRIDEATGRATFVASLTEESVALDVHPDGGLIAAGLENVYRIDPRSGAEQLIARFPPGVSASGDIAFVQDRMFVTGTRTPSSTTIPDVLIEVSIDEGTVTQIGSSIGFPCIWGLAPFGETLYGFTCRGELLSLDLATGAGRRLAELDVLRIGGGAAR